MIHIMYHWSDIDGLASAALAKRSLNLKGVKDDEIKFIPVSYEDFRCRLSSISKEVGEGDIVYILDVNINESWLRSRPLRPSVLASLKGLRARKCTLAWFDHHAWSSEAIAKVSPLTPLFKVDPDASSTCRLIKETLLPIDDVAASLAEVADETDGLLWRRAQRERHIDWRDLGWRWYLVSEAVNKGLASPQWVISLMAYKGSSWSQALEEYADKAKALIKLELDKFIHEKVKVKIIGSLKVALATGRIPCKASLLGLHIYLASGADPVIIIFPNGRVSVRSVKGIARNVALRLGGGGHPNAAGAMLPLPYKLLIKLFNHYPLGMIWRVIKKYLDEAGSSMESLNTT